MPGHHRSGSAVVLAGLFVLIFISRGRAFADKRQAVALVCAAAAAGCVGVVKYVCTRRRPRRTPLLWGALLLGRIRRRGSCGGVTGADHAVHPTGANDHRVAGDRARSSPRCRWPRGSAGSSPGCACDDACVCAAADRRAQPRRPLVGLPTTLPLAQAIPPPVVDPARVPPDGKPAPDQPMRQSNICARTITVAEPNVTVPAPGYMMLNVAKAWQYSTGNGVPVAVIDTGVNPSHRLAGSARWRLHHGRRRADGLRLARHHRGLGDRRSAAGRSDARAVTGRARIPTTGGPTCHRSPLRRLPADRRRRSLRRHRLRR